MPLYTCKRPDGGVVEKRLSFSQYEACKAGTLTIADNDGSPLEIVFNPGTLGFVMKDGVTGGWSTKNSKESQYRKVRNTEMARREKDHVFKSSLVPNFNGQEGHSWADVQDHVRSVKGVAAANTYNKLVSKEKAK